MLLFSLFSAFLSLSFASGSRIDDHHDHDDTEKNSLNFSDRCKYKNATFWYKGNDLYKSGFDERAWWKECEIKYETTKVATPDSLKLDQVLKIEEFSSLNNSSNDEYSETETETETASRNVRLCPISEVFDSATVIFSYFDHQTLVAFSKVSKKYHFLCSKHLSYKTGMNIIKMNKPLLFHIIFYTEFHDIFKQAFPQLISERIAWSDAVALLNLALDISKKANNFMDREEIEEHLKSAREFKYTPSNYKNMPDWFAKTRALLEYISHSSAASYFETPYGRQSILKKNKDWKGDDYHYYLSIYPHVSRSLGLTNYHAIKLLSTMMNRECNEVNLNCLISNMKSIAYKDILKQIQKHPHLNMSFFLHPSLTEHVCSHEKPDFKDLFYVEGLSNALYYQNRDLFVGILSAISNEHFPPTFIHDLEVLKTIFVTNSFVITSDMDFNNTVVFNAVFTFSEDREFVHDFFDNLSRHYVKRLINDNNSKFHPEDADFHFDVDHYCFRLSAEFHQSVLEYIFNFETLKFSWAQVELPEPENITADSCEKMINSRWIGPEDIFVRHCFFINPTSAVETKLISMINLEERRVFDKRQLFKFIPFRISEVWSNGKKFHRFVALNVLDLAVLTQNIPAISLILKRCGGTLTQKHAALSLEILDLALKNILEDPELDLAEYCTDEEIKMLESTIASITENINIIEITSGREGVPSGFDSLSTTASGVERMPLTNTNHKLCCTLN